MRIIFGLLLICSTFFCFSSEVSNSTNWNTCSNNTPYGIPQANKQSTVLACREGYAVLSDKHAKIPVWVAYIIQPQHVIGCVDRSDNFNIDNNLLADEQSSPQDYSKTGYDMGHMASAADMSWNQSVMQQSFLMTNVAPQLPELNRGGWRVLEASIRYWVFYSQRPVLIYTGPIYSNASKTIGDNVIIPDGFYKIIIDMDSKASLAFMFPHAKVSNIISTHTTISAIENAANVKFPVPEGIDKTKKEALWGNVDIKKLQQAKKNLCEVKQ